jgi:hypothetical protein
MNKFQSFKFQARLKLTAENLGFLAMTSTLVVVAVTPVVMFVRHFV